MNLDKLLLILSLLIVGLIFALLQTYESVKPYTDVVITVLSVSASLLAIIEFIVRKK
ncbi:MAG: hypothetical protein KBF93_26365 [Leptospiraceae bacterium]|nr:hypothetical protein [Leptospiraceae bacterium]